MLHRAVGRGPDGRWIPPHPGPVQACSPCAVWISANGWWAQGVLSPASCHFLDAKHVCRMHQLMSVLKQLNSSWPRSSCQ